MKEELRGFAHLATSRTVFSAARAGFFIIIAMLMEPYNYGQMAYLVSLAGSFSVVSRFGLPVTVIVYLSKGKTHLANQVNLLAITTTSLASIILVFINEFSAFLCLTSSLFFLYQKNQVGNQRYKRHLITALVCGGLTFGLGLPLFFAIGISGIIIGLALSNLVAVFPFFRNISLRMLSIKPIKDNYKTILNNFGVDVAVSLVKKIDKIIIGVWFGFLSLGVYNFNMQILFASEILSSVMYSFLLSEVSRGKQHKKISFLIVTISIALVISVIVAGPFVIKNLFPKFSDGIYPLQILIIAVIPNSISFVLMAKMQALESTKVGFPAIVKIGSLVILIGILGTAYGMVGLSISILVSASVYTTSLYYLYKKQDSKFMNP